MEKLLSFICAELDCYLDEIRSNCRGKISKKRKILILVLIYCGYSLSEISKAIFKNISSINLAHKSASEEEKQIAFTIIENYKNWLKYVDKTNFS